MIKLPVILETLELGEYHKDLQGQTFTVWVNPPKSLTDERDDIILNWQMADLELTRADLKKSTKQEVLERGRKSEAELESKMNEWFVRVWDQGPAETRRTIKEIADYQAQDPAFIGFVKRRTMEMLGDHRSGKKKSFEPQSTS